MVQCVLLQRAGSYQPSFTSSMLERHEEENTMNEKNELYVKITGGQIFSGALFVIWPC